MAKRRRRVTVRAGAGRDRGRGKPGLSQRKKPRRNPAPVPVARQVQEAVDRYTGFRGDAPREVRKVQVPGVPKVLLTMGECLGIMYRTERDGQVDNFLHRFRKKSRPTLAVSSDGKTLYLLRGAYRVTDRGIEDA